MSVVEPDIIVQDVDSRDMIATLNKSEIDQQISTAKSYPRQISVVLKDIESLSCLDKKTAESMFYSLPRGGKRIIGPSIRFAEIVASCWSNIRTGARIVSIDAKFVTAQGVCFDLEKNVSSTVEIQQRITNKGGVRYNDDMIKTACNAAISLAMRNAIFKVIPRALTENIFEKVKETAVGKVKDMAVKRKEWLDFFGRLNFKPKVVFEYLGVKGAEDMEIEDLIALSGLVNAVKDGETTYERAFAKQSTDDKASTTDIGDKLPPDKGNARRSRSKPKEEAAEQPQEPKAEPDPSEQKELSVFEQFKVEVSEATQPDEVQMLYSKAEVDRNSGKMTGKELASLKEHCTDRVATLTNEAG